MGKNFLVKRIKSFCIQLLWELLGCFSVSVGIYCFAVNANFPLTGFSGIALILFRLFNTPIGLVTIALNIPVAIICFKLLGKKFFISSVRCMVISSLMIDYVAPLLPMYEGNRLLAALCTGIFAGVGYALIYSRNSSTGGMDFITLAIKSKKPYISLGNIILIADIIVILIGGILLKDVDGIIYGAIISYIFATVADKVMYGMNAGKLALIVTDNGEAVCKIIDDCSKRGSTILNGNGGYNGQKKQVVMCASSSKEMFQIRRQVREADPQCFFIIMESNEVHGKGFKMLNIGEQNM